MEIGSNMAGVKAVAAHYTVAYCLHYPLRHSAPSDTRKHPNSLSFESIPLCLAKSFSSQNSTHLNPPTQVTNSPRDDDYWDDSMSILVGFQRIGYPQFPTFLLTPPLPSLINLPSRFPLPSHAVRNPNSRNSSVASVLAQSRAIGATPSL